MTIKPQWAKENTISTGKLSKEIDVSTITRLERVIINASNRGNKSCQITLENYDISKEILEMNGYSCVIEGELDYGGHVEVKWM